MIWVAGSRYKNGALVQVGGVPDGEDLTVTYRSVEAGTDTYLQDDEATFSASANSFDAPYSAGEGSYHEVEALEAWVGKTVFIVVEHPTLGIVATEEPTVVSATPEVSGGSTGPTVRLV